MNQTVLLLGAATVALGGTSAYLWQEVLEERERNEVVEARVSELESRLQDFAHLPEQPPPPVPPLPPDMSPPPMAPPLPAPRAEATPSSTIGRMDPSVFFAREQERMQDPEYRALRRQQHKMGLLRMYSDLGKSLNLPSDEVDKLLDLLAEHQLNSMPPFIPPGADQPDADRSEWARRMQESQRKKEADIRALLGDTKYPEWQDYQSSMGARMQVRNLRSILEESSEPLREDQYLPLVTAIADEQRRLGTETRSELFKTRPSGPMTHAEQLAMMEQSLERTAEHNQRMRDAAASYLSAAQLERFDKMLNQQLEMQRLNLRMMGARGEPGAMMQTFISDGATIVTSQGTGPISQTVISQGTVAPPPPQQ